MSSVYSVSPPWACMSYASVLTTRNQINRLSSASQVMAWNVWPGFPCAVNEELQILRTQNDMHFVSKRRFPSCPVMRRLGGAAWWCNLRSLGSFPPHSLELVPVTQRPGLGGGSSDVILLYYTIGLKNTLQINVCQFSGLASLGWALLSSNHGG